MIRKLTPDAVAKVKAEAKPYEIRDSDLKGLLLRVQPSGAKSFVVVWGRGQRRTLGRYPVMTVAGARAAALAALAEATQHGAPLAVIEARKPASEKPITLGRFIEEHFKPWVLAHQSHPKATLDALQLFSDLYERELRSIVALDIDRFKARRRKQGRKPATINRDLDRIRTVFSRAVEWEFLQKHPMRTVKRYRVDNRRVRYLSDEEERSLRAALEARESDRRAARERYRAWCKARGVAAPSQWPVDAYTDHLVPLVLLAMNTGLRRRELLELEWRCVNLSLRLLTVEANTAKTRKTRHVSLSDEALEVLVRWRGQCRGSGLVVPSPSGARFGNINKAWGGIVQAAKLVDFHFHDLRHTFASKLVMAGVDLNTVRELMGHDDIKLTLRYAHLAPHKLADAVAKLRAAR